VRFPESWSSTSLAARKTVPKHRQDTFVLDTAFVLIEGHPPVTASFHDMSLDSWFS